MGAAYTEPFPGPQAGG